MRRTEEHDILLLREILLYEPYNQRKGSVERGKVWDLLAESLNKINNPLFRVTGRSIRVHLKTLIDNFKRKEREEEKASGINPDETEQEALLGLEKSHISKIYEACHTCYTVVQNLNMPHLLTEK